MRGCIYREESRKAYNRHVYVCGYICVCGNGRSSKAYSVVSFGAFERLQFMTTHGHPSTFPSCIYTTTSSSRARPPHAQPTHPLLPTHPPHSLFPPPPSMQTHTHRQNHSPLSSFDHQISSKQPIRFIKCPSHPRPATLRPKTSFSGYQRRDA